MKPYFGMFAASAACIAITMFGSSAFAEGSRDLYPATYPTGNTQNAARANLDLQPGNRYLGRVNRRGFSYVYAQAGEYITLGSSNVGFDGDILVYNPGDFGFKGDEVLPANEDFSCLNGTLAPTGTHYSGGITGQIATRAQELAGPASPSGFMAGANTFTPCAYQAPVDGIYGVVFTRASNGGNPNGNVSSVSHSSNSVAAWDITIRPDSSSLTDINGRLFTYAFVGFTGANRRPIRSTLYYVTTDGYRYQQDMRGLDPNGYALYANTFGYLDNNEPLYKDVRGTGFLVENLPDGVTTQTAQYPIFFTDITGAGSEVDIVLGELGIPLVPPEPQISDVTFTGAFGSGETSPSVGGTFSFSTTDTVSYQIVLSRNGGGDFDPSNPDNRYLTGIAFSGTHNVTWDGLDNKGEPFEAQDDPYEFLSYGRAGEVHFPIVDAENNGSPADGVVAGGPTITRLNGTSRPDLPAATTVFYDDRGYLTSSGDLVGKLNGTLCDTNDPEGPTEPVNLLGADSTTVYRDWEYGSNGNGDCNPGTGWGDAKGINLWTYYLTESTQEELIIKSIPIDLATTNTILTNVVPGSRVVGTFGFSNNGTTDVSGVTYSMTLPPGISSSLSITGSSYVYDNLTGVVTFTGPALPSSLNAGDRITGLTYSFNAPAAGVYTSTTEIQASGVTDALPANNISTQPLIVSTFDLSAQITGVPSMENTGNTVGGAVTFASLGPNNATDVSYSLEFGTSSTTKPASVTFTSLPAGVTASYDAGTGAVTFTGMPNDLPFGEFLAISFTYPGPAIDDSSVEITANISANPADDLLDNNTSVSSTSFRTRVITSSTAVSCANDLPYVDYNLTAQFFTPSGSATVEFIDSGNNVVDTLTNQPLTGGRVLWPGASVDGGGVGTSWPGWVFNSGYWQPTTSTVLPTVGIRFTVDGVVDSTTETYPAIAASCYAAPPGAENVDLLSTVSLPASANPGAGAQGSVSFVNNSPVGVYLDSVSLTLDPGLGTVNFSNLPAGVGATYSSATGVVTFTGLPSILLPGTDLSGILFDFTTPAAGTVTATSDITVGGAIADIDPDNDDDTSTMTVNRVVNVAAASICDKDTPYVEYEVTAAGFTPGPADLATIEFVGASGAVVQTLTDQPLSRTRILWPEAAVDADGNPTDWPGWDFVNGEWVVVPSDVRPNMTVRITVNPTDSISVSYPPATPACAAQPPGVDTVDLATTTTLPTDAETGDTVQGTVSFENIGVYAVENVSYSLTLTPGLGAVTFTTLPAGVTALYNDADGTVSFTGLPSSLSPGATYTGINFEFVVPADGSVEAVSSIDTSGPIVDGDETNNTSSSTLAVRALTLDITAVCDNDTPYIEYEVTPVGFTPDPTDLATVEFLGASGAVVQTLTDQPLSRTRILWPEAAVDADGNPTDWPGWDFVNGEWVVVPSDVRPNMTVRITVNPTESLSVSYPPATPACATNPPGVDTVDLATGVTMPSSGEPGTTVQGSVSYQNLGVTTVTDVSYTLALSPGLDGVVFSNLPSGVTAAYNTGDGSVAFTGLASDLSPSADYTGITFEFIVPATGSVTAASSISTAGSVPDGNTDNNNASATFAVGGSGPDALPTPVPSLPLPFLIALVALTGSLGRQRLKDKSGW
ncbi:MAG: hypothetical protein V7720_01795 [Halioglobus sp.]